MIYQRFMKKTQSNSASTRGRVFGLFRFTGFCLLVSILVFSSACNSATATENETEKAKNEAALAQAQKNIENFRKGEAQIKVLDPKGKLVTDAKLNIKQISHDFKFGCYLKIDDLAPGKLPTYEKDFARLFNFAVVGTYWDFVENEKGRENWTWFERETALARKLNLKIEAAPILWGTNQAGTPAWLPRRKDELLPVLEHRVKSTLTKNAETVDDWEIVNEPLAPKTDVFAARAGSNYVEAAFAQAREVAPGERLMLNEYGVFGAETEHNFNRDRYFALLAELIQKNVALDIIGIQAHANGEWYSPANVAAELNRYATLGKPIQITEFSAQTFDYKNRRTPLKISGNYQTGVWDEEKQAEFYREFYTVAFGNPQVEAIVQWGLDDERAWLPGIGLIDRDGNQKRNYKALDRLINDEWRTNLQINSSGNKAAKFRGFYGDYEVEVFINGKIAGKTEFKLKKDDKNEWIINL